MIKSPQISVAWISERELAVRVPRVLMSPGLRRSVSQAPQPTGLTGTPGTTITLGAESIHFLWGLISREIPSDPDAAADSAIKWITNLIERDQHETEQNPLPQKTILIQARYGDRASIQHDLDRLAKFNNLTIDEVIHRHLATTYVVAFCGFQPGFAYLEPLSGSPGIHAPRLEIPRAKVPAGAVALGGDYCGIYPASGPGGWNIIGLCPDRVDWKPGELVRFEEKP